MAGYSIERDIIQGLRRVAPVLLPACVFLLLALPPSVALASANDTPLGDMLCTAAGWMTGNTGKGIESIAMLILGILAMFGKLSWDKAVLEIVGIAVLYGAAAIVTSATGGAVTGCG